MPDGLAIPAGYVMLAGIWFIWHVTTPMQRRDALEWAWVALLIFGALGFLSLLLSGQSVAPSGGL